MRPNLCRTVLHVSVAAVLLLTLNADSILQSDAGLYKRHQSHRSVSHAINDSVYVKGDPTCATQKNHTNSSSALDPEFKERPWMYVYTAAGIAAFVIIVIVASVASMQGCKGKSKKEARTRDQRTAIPMAEQPSAHTSLQASPPPVPPSRRSTQREASPSKPNGSPLPGDGGPQNTVVEEKSSIVYAALNHRPRGAAAARPPRPEEESSEYAVIRVEGH